LKTIWYMGVKSRLIQGFIARALEESAPVGSTLLDIFSGSGAIATWASSRFRVVANDAQRYAAAIARAYLRSETLELDPEADLAEAFADNYRRLARALAEPLALEDAWIRAAGFEPARADEGFETLGERPSTRQRAVDLVDYRAFALARTPLFDETREATFEGPFERARPLLERSQVLARRADPRRAPYILATAYYANCYLGIRQAIATDSLRRAIDALDGPAKREHYLAALLHALSITTSATSHFCQPRGMTNEGEVRRVLERRSVSIASRTLSFSRAIEETRAEVEPRLGNAALSGDWRRLFPWRGPGAAPSVVYVDPPYTADNYSRFYHLLEVVSDYDYPPLDVRAGKVTKGRYPSVERRLQSAFCRRGTVEEETRDLLGACAGAGAAVVFSYSRESGLLLRKWREDEGLSDAAALERFLGLFRERWRRVELHEKPVLHSGQGDSNVGVTELLVVGKGPR